MADLTLRLIKGSPLSHEELDDNFIALDQQVGSSAMAIGPNPPTSPDTGEMWLDTNEDVVKIYDGSVWFEMPSTSSAAPTDSIDAGAGGDDF